MMMRRFILAIAFLAAGIASAAAVQPDEVLPDPALETRARALSKTLRCMVCQNQSIDDSDAPLARDLRLLVRERLKAGDSDAQVRDFLVARYGEFVLLEPRKDARTALLWGIPILVLLVGLLISLRFFRRRRAELPVPLTIEERERLARLSDSPADLSKM